MKKSWLCLVVLGSVPMNARHFIWEINVLCIIMYYVLLSPPHCHQRVDEL